MSPTEKVLTNKAPKPLPQFSQAVKYNGMVYCSGSIGFDPATSSLVEGGVKNQTRRALQNLAAVLEAAGSSLDSVVKVNIFLTTMDNFAAMNEAYDEFFKQEVKPTVFFLGAVVNPSNLAQKCRTCVAVYQLPFQALVEIECTAFLSPGPKL
ncbi:L-psp endoribonuclease family protein [Apiospora aurea]|uniref:L-psp endoribonuclease family protein n=1 Tax=Apiospora aurea TaxID=335848 RepID=A0ABR1PWJ7_9PEZI